MCCITQVRGAPPRFGSFNGFLNTGHSRSGRSKKQRTTGIARAEIRNSQPVAGMSVFPQLFSMQYMPQ